MQCLKTSGLLEKNNSEDTLYVSCKAESNKALFKVKAYEHMSTKREKEGENSTPFT